MQLPLRAILCATDFSDPSYEALKTAADLASHFNAQLLLLHVLPAIPHATWPGADLEGREAFEPGLVDYEERLHASATQKLNEVIKERLPENIESRAFVRKGDPALEIVRMAEDNRASLIVISTHGMSGWRQVALGSVAERVVRLSCTPVLTIRSPRVLL